MLKLLSFEIQKKWKFAVGILGAYFLIYFVLLFKFKGEGIQSLEEFGLKLVLFVILGSALFFVSAVSAINNLRLEAKHSTRDLYFSIPMSAYAKIGSKVLVSIVEIVASIGIGAYSAAKAIEILTKTTIISDFFKELFDLNTDIFIYAFTVQGLNLIMMLLTIYLSFAVFRSFFSQVKFGAVITIVIYVALTYGINKLTSILFKSVDDITSLDPSNWMTLGVYGLFVVVVFGVIGFLFEHRVSFD